MRQNYGLLKFFKLCLVINFAKIYNCEKVLINHHQQLVTSIPNEEFQQLSVKVKVSYTTEKKVTQLELIIIIRIYSLK